VERATTFLASFSNNAAALAIDKVVNPKTNQLMKFNMVSCLTRKTNQIPAVTRVDLWTRALTGVGAAIAAGNHLINGHCALLVKEIILIKKITCLLDPK